MKSVTIIISHLTFLKKIDKKSGGNAMALYKCECGNEKEIRISHVKSLKTISCGCGLSGKGKRERTKDEKVALSLLNKTHGLSKHPLYKIYYGIIKRCENKKCKAYPRYGGIGVKMCDEWRNDFVKFYDWALENGWKVGMEIDKDIKAMAIGIEPIAYSPEMCSVVTQKENMNATILNKIIEYDGRKQTMKQWSDEYGINYKALWSRLNRGWDFETALFRQNVTTKESGFERRKILLNTQTGIFYFGLKEAAWSAGINENTLFYKLDGKRKNNTHFVYA